MSDEHHRHIKSILQSSMTNVGRYVHCELPRLADIDATIRPDPYSDTDSRREKAGNGRIQNDGGTAPWM